MQFFFSWRTVLFGTLPTRLVCYRLTWLSSSLVRSFIPLFMSLISALSIRLPLRHVVFILLATLFIFSSPAYMFATSSPRKSWFLPILASIQHFSVPPLCSNSWVDPDPISSFHILMPPLDRLTICPPVHCSLLLLTIVPRV